MQRLKALIENILACRVVVTANNNIMVAMVTKASKLLAAMVKELNKPQLTTVVKATKTQVTMSKGNL